MGKRFIVPAIILLLALIIPLAFYIKKDKKTDAVRTTGIVEAEEVNLSTNVSGRISMICCKEADRVKKGQVVIRLESDELKASVAEAMARVKRARAELKVAESVIKNSKANVQSTLAEVKSAEADVDSARLQMEEAKRQMDRAEALYREEFISKAELDLRTTNYETSLTAFDASKARLSLSTSKTASADAQLDTSISQMYSAEARLKEAEASLSYHEARLKDTVVKTPVSGTVLFNAVKEGEVVSPAMTILTVADLDNLWIRVDIDEASIEDIRLQDEAVVSVGGLKDKVFRARVFEIGRYAEFATQRDVTRGRQDIKTFRVKIKAEDTKGILKPGMTVNVEFPMQR